MNAVKPSISTAYCPKHDVLEEVVGVDAIDDLYVEGNIVDGVLSCGRRIKFVGARDTWPVLDRRGKVARLKDDGLEGLS